MADSVIYRLCPIVFRGWPYSRATQGPHGLTLARLSCSPLFLEPVDRARRLRAGLALASLRTRELGDPCLLLLEAIPYGFRPFLVDCDRKKLIAVIERIEARIGIARDR